MTPDCKTVFLQKAYQAGLASGHIWPDYAACEAALESAWGTSTLAIKANNLFGQKASSHTPADEILELPTHEEVNGVMVPTMANWVKFPDWNACFAARMDVLRRLASIYPDYALALAATSGEDFVNEVSHTWSTDHLRGQKVLAIYEAHKSAFLPDPV